MIVAATLVVLLAAVSCTHKTYDKHKYDPATPLLTKQEFIQYFENNDTKLKLSDFDGIDIDQFIKSMQITSESITSLSQRRIDYYLSDKDRFDKDAQIYVREVRRVESTEEDYTKFIDAYLKKVEAEYKCEYIGEYGKYLNRYRVTTRNNAFSLYIGATKDFDKFTTVKESDIQYCKIQIPAGELQMRVNFSYNADSKFFLAIGSSDFDNEDVIYKLSLLFIQTK
jgi:hypothetical protein